MLLYLHSKDATNKILTTKKHTKHTKDLAQPLAATKFEIRI